MNHEPRGTCVPGCPDYGRCHDGCGRATKIAPRTVNRRSVKAGHPSVWVSGAHAIRSRGGHGKGCLSSRGVEADRVRPLVRWLGDRYSVPMVAKVTGVPLKTLRHILYGEGPGRPAKFVRWEHARAIVDLVTQHRRPVHPVASQFEVDRNVLTREQREEVRRELVAAERQMFREGRTYDGKRPWSLAAMR